MMPVPTCPAHTQPMVPLAVPDRDERGNAYGLLAPALRGYFLCSVLERREGGTLRRCGVSAGVLP